MRRAHSESRVAELPRSGLPPRPITLHTVQPLDLSELAGELELSEQAADTLLNTVDHWPDTPLSPPPNSWTGPATSILEADLENKLELRLQQICQLECQHEQGQGREPENETGLGMELEEEGGMGGEEREDEDATEEEQQQQRGDEGGDEGGKEGEDEGEGEDNSEDADEHNQSILRRQPHQVEQNTSAPLKLWASLRRLWDVFLPTNHSQHEKLQQKQHEQIQHPTQNSKRRQPELKRSLSSSMRDSAPSQLTRTESSSSTLRSFPQKKASLPSAAHRKVPELSANAASQSIHESFASPRTPLQETAKPRSPPPPPPPRMSAMFSSSSKYIPTGTNPTVASAAPNQSDRHCTPLAHSLTSLHLPPTMHEPTSGPTMTMTTTRPSSLSSSSFGRPALPPIPLLPLPQTAAGGATRPVSDMFEHDLCEADLSPAARPSDDDLSHLRSISSPMHSRDRRFSEPQLATRAQAVASLRQRFSFLPPSPFATPPRTPTQACASPLFPSPMYQPVVTTRQSAPAPWQARAGDVPLHAVSAGASHSRMHTSEHVPAPAAASLQPAMPRLGETRLHTMSAGAAPSRMHTNGNGSLATPRMYYPSRAAMLHAQPAMIRSRTFHAARGEQWVGNPSIQSEATTPVQDDDTGGYTAFSAYTRPKSDHATSVGLFSKSASVGYQHDAGASSPVVQEQPNPVRSRSYRSYFRTAQADESSTLHVMPRSELRSSDSKVVRPTMLRRPLPRAATHHSGFHARGAGAGASDAVLDRRIAQLQALQQQLRTQRRPADGDGNGDGGGASTTSAAGGHEVEVGMGLTGMGQYRGVTSELPAMDALSERRRHVLVTQQRRLASTMRMSKVGDVPRNVRLPMQNGGSSSKGGHGGGKTIAAESSLYV